MLEVLGEYVKNVVTRPFTLKPLLNDLEPINISELILFGLAEPKSGGSG